MSQESTGSRPETIRLPLDKMLEALAIQFGYEADFLITRLPDGGVKLQAAPETKLLNAPPVGKVYTFTRADWTELKKMGIRT